MSALMKSYQRQLLFAAASHIATQEAVKRQAEKENEAVKKAEPKQLRDWIVDTRKKNVETKKCRSCDHAFKGARRRKFCTVCAPFETTKRLAEEEARSLEVRPEPQR